MQLFAWLNHVFQLHCAGKFFIHSIYRFLSGTFLHVTWSIYSKLFHQATTPPVVPGMLHLSSTRPSIFGGRGSPFGSLSAMSNVNYDHNPREVVRGMLSTISTAKIEFQVTIDAYIKRLESNFSAHLRLCCGGDVVDASGHTNILGLILELYKAPDSSDSIAEFCTGWLSYEQELIILFEKIMVPALRLMHSEMVELVKLVPFPPSQFPSNYDGTAAGGWFWTRIGNIQYCILDTKKYYHKLLQLFADKDIPICKRHIILTKPIYELIFTLANQRFVGEKLDNLAHVYMHLRNIFSIHSEQEFFELSDHDCYAILKGAQGVNFHQTKYYKTMIREYIREDIILQHKGDWDAENPKIYSSKNHTSDSFQAMVGFIFGSFTGSPSHRGFIRRIWKLIPLKTLTKYGGTLLDISLKYNWFCLWFFILAQSTSTDWNILRWCQRNYRYWELF